MIWPAAHRRARVDAAVAAYTLWRSECDAVRAAYRDWLAASASGERPAFEAYQVALDREERAARTYGGLMSRVRGFGADRARSRVGVGGFPVSAVER
jgi:hypothetical protein